MSHHLDSDLPRKDPRLNLTDCERAAANAGQCSFLLCTPPPRPREAQGSGTVTDPALLADDRATYLVAIVVDNDRYALAWTDVAAGEFKAGEFDAESAVAELQRLGAAEILVSEDTLVPQLLMGYGAVTRVGATTGAMESLRAAFPDGALADLPLAEVAAGLVVRYLGETAARGQLPPLDAPAPVASTDALQMDAVTQRHLEIVETERSRDRVGSLLGAVDRCATPMGRRMLRSWLLRPLRDLRKIAVRQTIIGELVANPHLLQAVCQLLTRTPDLERTAVGSAVPRHVLAPPRRMTCTPWRGYRSCSTKLANPSAMRTHPSSELWAASGLCSGHSLPKPPASSPSPGQHIRSGAAPAPRWMTPWTSSSMARRGRVVTSIVSASRLGSRESKSNAAPPRGSFLKSR